MSRVYSAQLAVFHGLGGGETAEWPGYTAVIRDIEWFTPGPTGGELQLIHLTTGATFYQVIVTDPESVGGFWTQWQGRVVILDGQQIQVNGAGPVDVFISGYLLTST